MFKIEYKHNIIFHSLFLILILSALFFANRYIFISTREETNLIFTITIVFSIFLYPLFCYTYFHVFLFHSERVSYVHRRNNRIYTIRDFENIKEASDAFFFNTQKYLVFVHLKRITKNKLEYNLSIVYGEAQLNHEELLIIAKQSKESLIKIIEKILGLEPTSIWVRFEEYNNSKVTHRTYEEVSKNTFYP